MAKVALLSPPLHSYNRYNPPLPLMYLASVISNRGIDCEIIDIKADKKTREKGAKTRISQEILEEIRRIKPSIAGITCYSPDFNDVIHISERIKEFNAKIKIIVGGIHPTLHPEDFLYNGSPVDCVVIGEGEKVIGPLIDKLIKDQDISGISGVGFYDNKDDKAIVRGVAEVADDLDEIPFPAYDKINMNHYTMPNPYAIRGVYLSSFHIVASRGCPSQCSFCVSKRLAQKMADKNIFRIRSAKNIVDEIEFLKKKYKIDAFYFADDAFTIKASKVIGICDEMIKRDLNIAWGCSTRINSVNEELIQKMKEAGCLQIDFGVESGSDKMLSLLKKGIDVAQIKKAFALCNKYKIRTFANILLNTPEETETDLSETLKLLTEIKPSIVLFNMFIPYPGTDIYYEKIGRLSKDEYYLLGLSPDVLLKDKRFRFSEGSMDYKAFYSLNHCKYNKLFTAIKFHMSPGFIKLILQSKRKLDYILNSGKLMKEVLAQKLLPDY